MRISKITVFVVEFEGFLNWFHPWEVPAYPPTSSENHQGWENVFHMNGKNMFLDAVGTYVFI